MQILKEAKVPDIEHGITGRELGVITTRPLLLHVAEFL